MNYDGTVTYESAIHDLLARIPDLVPLYREQMDYLGDEELPYVVFGSFLIPVMERALEAHDYLRIEAICGYLEEAAVSAGHDAGLSLLLRVEIGEWLNGTSWENDLSASLGEETKRICRYVPGLGTQRAMRREEQMKRGKLARMLDHFRS